MESKFIDIIYKATEESKKLLKANNYEVNKYLEFNLFTFNYMLEYDQLIHFTKKLPSFNFDILKFRDLFINEIEKKLKSIKNDLSNLDSAISISNPSRYLDVSARNYVRSLEGLLEHKGFMMTAFFDFSFELQDEFKSVISTFKNASQGNGKYQVPYMAYISFFQYPIIFTLDEPTIYHLKQDFEMEAFKFLGTFGKLTNHIQQFTVIENLEVLKNKGVRIK